MYRQFSAGFSSWATAIRRGVMSVMGNGWPALRRLSATNSVLNGEFDIDVDVVSIGVNWRF